VSEAAMLAGDNAALVGEEIIGFRDAVLIAPGTYRLFGFMRASRRTGPASASCCWPARSASSASATGWDCAG
jgi:hypothetical protein